MRFSTGKHYFLRHLTKWWDRVKEDQEAKAFFSGSLFPDHPAIKSTLAAYLMYCGFGWICQEVRLAEEVTFTLLLFAMHYGPIIILYRDLVPCFVVARATSP